MKDGKTFRVCAFLPIVAAVLSRATPLVAAGQLPSRSGFAPMPRLEASICQEPVEVDARFGDDDELGSSGSAEARLYPVCLISGLPYTEGYLTCRMDQRGGRSCVFLIAPKNDPPARV